MPSPEPGQTLPKVALPRDGGSVLDLADLRGGKVVLFFYPRDDTSGCTLEAIDFTSHLPEFETAGATVVGISKDSVASHDRFRAKHGLQVILLSDADGEVTERFGLWVEKSMYGKKFMGIERATFLIDAGGVVREVWRKVKVPGHVEAVLAATRAL
jgi:peroxiredoxin Q/BCP